MRNKKLLFTALFATLTAPLCASQALIAAKELERADSNISAIGDAVAVGKGYFVRADRLDYDDSNKTLHASGFVSALKDSTVFAMCDDAKFWMDSNKSSFDNLFIFSSIENLWTKADTANSASNLYYLNGAISSSCNTEKPDWYIRYDRGVFDSSEKRMQLDNATLVIRDTPVLFAPYFSFSVDKTRRSGLLAPDLGVKGNEGFIYAQPIFFTTSPESNWDLESTPQIRTKRGIGLNETLRFIDSPYSQGVARFGLFKDFGPFTSEYNLKNSSHYGAGLMYERSRLFSATSSDQNGSFSDGVYANLNYLNDIDYVNLQNRKLSRTLVVDKIATSKLNYYAQKGSDFAGIYMKYFIDASKTSNADTLQELPRAQYHRSFSSIFTDDLHYSADLRLSRLDRNSGMKAMQYEAAMPVGYYGELFDGFVGWALQENFYLNRVRFSNDPTGLNQNEYQFSNSSHKLRLYTSLLKAYEEYMHHIDAEVIYTKPGFKSEKNYPVNANELTGLVTSHDENENAGVKLAQFLYDCKGNLLLTHRLTQTYNVDSSRASYRYGDMRNEVTFKLADKIDFVTDTAYSFERHKLSEATSSLLYNDERLSTRFSHVFKDKAGILGVDRSSFLALEASYKYDFIHHVFANYEYDAHARETRAWGVGFGMKKRCLGYEIAVKNEVLPILTSVSPSSIRSYTVYFRLNLYPIGGINQMYSISQN